MTKDLLEHSMYSNNNTATFYTFFPLPFLFIHKLFQDAVWSEGPVVGCWFLV